jgi:hypothetical protein
MEEKVGTFKNESVQNRNVEDLRTSKEWDELLCKPMKFKILDPDGWDRSNWSFSWEEELITKAEFKMRVMNSTVSGMINEFFTS